MFDPLGIAAPVTIRFRIIQQTIWRKGLKWDDEITSAVLPEIFDTIAELQELSAVAIPRRLFPYNYHDITLHVFTDASYSALAAVAYFVYRQSPISPREVCFVLGKAPSCAFAATPSPNSNYKQPFWVRVSLSSFNVNSV